MSQASENTVSTHWLQEFLRQPAWAGPSWKRHVMESGLPAEIQTVIRKVLARCRLSWGEQAAVAAELVAHFADGLDAGQSPSQLIEAFGDPAVAAPLIQSSKKRNRPMWKKALQASGLGLAGLGAAYIIVTIWFHFGKPNPSIDFVARMNQPVVEAPDSEKAWPIYRPMWTKYKFSEGGRFDIPEMWVEEEPGEKRLIQSGDPGWEDAVAAFANHEDLLDSFRRGARKPYYGIELKNNPSTYSDEDFEALYPNRTRDSLDPYSDLPYLDEETNRLVGESVVTVLLPHVQVLRTAARIFVVDTRIAVANNDPERAVEDIETMFGLARHAAEGPVLVCSLVGYAVSGIAFSQLEEVLVENPEFFDEAQLARLQRSVEQCDPRGWLHLEGERMMVQDMIQRVYTDDGDGDGRITPQGLKILTGASQWQVTDDSNQLASEYPTLWRVTQNVAGPVSLFVAASRKEVTEKANELLNRAESETALPFWEAQSIDLDSGIEGEEMKFALLSMLLPAYQQVRNAMDRTLGRQEGVRGAIALHRYRLQTGEWPQSWDAIPKSILSSPPIDQINGKPLRFKIVDDQPLIYSVGNDRDDDGGTDLIRGTEGEIQPRSNMILEPKPGINTLNGDWIVWPQNDRNG